MWSVIGALAEATSLPVTTGVTCPTVRIHPAIIAQAAATSARDARRPLHARRRQRRGAQRAHPRRPLAGGRRAPGDARGGRRGDPARSGRAASSSHHGRALHGRERPHLRPARRAAADHRLGLRAEGDRARRPDRRRLRHDLARQGRDRLYRSEGGKGPVHAGTKVCLRQDEDEARETVLRLWPNEALPGELAQVLPTPRALRAGVRARHRRTCSSRPSARTSTSTSSRCRQYGRPASTSCSSSRSGLTPTCSSRGGRPRFSRALEARARGFAREASTKQGGRTMRRLVFLGVLAATAVWTPTAGQ